MRKRNANIKVPAIYFFTSSLLGLELVWQALQGLPCPMTGVASALEVTNRRERQQSCRQGADGREDCQFERLVERLGIVLHGRSPISANNHIARICIADDQSYPPKPGQNPKDLHTGLDKGIGST
jgi:hypothetical protein